MKLAIFVLGFALALVTATPATADDRLSPQDSEGWKVSFSPYAWVAGVKGDIGLPGGGSVEFDRSFDSDLKFAFMGALELEHGNFVIFLDGNYLSLKSVSNDIKVPPHLDGEVKTELLEATPLIGYKVFNTGNTSAELLGGVRVISLKNDIHLELPEREVDANRSRSTVAPVVASRLKTSLGGHWNLSFYGDIGGLTDLDLTWQLLGVVHYRLGDHWSLGAGYRYLSLRSDKSLGDINARFSGPLLGATYSF